MRVLRYWRFGLGATVALCVSLAFAADPVSFPECDHKPTPADVEGAKGAHKAASQFYDRGDYDKAIGLWRDAYTFDCTAPGILVNIGNAYEKKGDKVTAIAIYKLYIKRSGPDPTIQEKIKNLEASLAPPPATATASASAPPTASASVAPTASASAPASASVAPTVTPPPTTAPPYGAAPWVVVGGGAVVGLTGGLLLGTGLGQISDAEKNCPNRKCSSDKSKYIDIGNAGRTKTGIGIAALSIGGVALAGGLIWQLAFNNPPPASSAAPKAAGPTGVRVIPALAPGHAGVSVTGAF